MEIRTCNLAGVMILTPQAFGDNRGFFKETFSASKYASVGIASAFVQDNLSLSRRHALRGLHADPRMSKLVQVLHGSAFDVIVDLRRGSSTYLRHVGIHLRAGEHTQIYIPEGCLHGFLSLEDDTLLMYKQTAEYDPTQELGVAWNDPDLAIEWPLNRKQPVVSPKDAANPTLRDLGYL